MLKNIYILTIKLRRRYALSATRTHDTNIICVTVTVRCNISPSIVSTAPKWGLCPCTLHVVQPYFPLPSSIVPKSYSFVKTKLTTCNLGIIHILWVPAGITHCSPLSIVVDLYKTGNTCRIFVLLKNIFNKHFWSFDHSVLGIMFFVILFKNHIKQIFKNHYASNIILNVFQIKMCFSKMVKFRRNSVTL
jgi:hypothetical protein